MNSISIIINTLTEEEKQEFLLQQKKKNRRGDTKNVALFKLLESGKTKNADISLYGKPSKNSYHALCKRLQDNLIDFVASKSFSGESSEEMEILKSLLAARIFFEHKKYKIAFKILLKAEKKALQLDLYSILTEIYHTKIQFTHLNPSLVLSTVISEAEKNLKLFQNEMKLTMAYASIKEQLKTSNRKSTLTIVSESLKTYAINIDHSLTYKSLCQLLHIASAASKLQSDYYTLYPYTTEAYALVRNKAALADKHRFYHIEILNLMAISSFRNKDFEKSLGFIRKMEAEMNKEKKVYYSRFSEKLILLKALHNNYTGNYAEAIQHLEAFPKDSLQVQLTLIMCYFQQNNYKQAHSIFKEFYHSDIWFEKKTGWIWVLKKNIIEILLLIELDKLDLVLSRLQSFKKKFTARLKDIGEERVLVFMKLVALYYEDPKQVTTKAFKEKVENAFNWIGSEKEDIFVMSFYAWLKAKMEEKSTYETTLELVSQ